MAAEAPAATRPGDRPLLEVEDLVVDYLTAGGPRRAVAGVSFQIQRGEIFGLVGESGSGKSTLAHALLRLAPPPAVIRGGQVRLAGCDLLALDGPALRAMRGRQVALVPQSGMSALHPLLRIGAQMADGLRAHAGDPPFSRAAGEGRPGGAGEPRLDAAEIQRRVHEALVLVGLEAHHADRYPHELSGGMRQRAVIAAALVLRPQLVILDESTAALDLVVQRELLERFVALQAELGFAALFISHDLPLTLSLCRRVGVLQSGRLVESADAATLAHGPRHPYAQELMRASARPPTAAPPAASPPVTSAQASPQPILSVRDLRRVFPARPTPVRAVDGVSFDVCAGEVVALVGESGSGKSTIARILLRLLAPSAGQLFWRGRDVLASEPRRPSLAYRADVQMIFQDPFAVLNPVHTVEYHLARPLRRHRRARTRREVEEAVLALLETVGLHPPAEMARRRPHQLSGGERQRVGIARALAVGPALLVADEPTSMLDASIRVEILELLRSLKQSRGLGYLYITHDLGSARRLADRVLVLHAGRIVESGPAHEVLERPRHPYTRSLLDAAPRPPGKG